MMESEKRARIVEGLRNGKLADLAVRVGVPKRYLGKNLAGLICPEHLKINAMAAVHSKRGVFITGPTGAGKTHLAVALLQEWWAVNLEAVDVWERSTLPIFIPVVELLLELKESFGGSRSEREILKRYVEAPFLVLDDLGSEKLSEWSVVVLYALIDGRYRAMVPTVVTSNYNLEEISRRLDDRIASRLVEMGEVITLEGKDFRLSSVERGATT